MYIPDDLKHVSRTVAGVELSSHLLEVILILFDENSELLLVMATRDTDTITTHVHTHTHTHTQWTEN